MLNTLFAKPTRCENCGGGLDATRNEWRDTILKKSFCSRNCLEHYRLSKVTEGSRLVHLIAIFLIPLMLLLPQKAEAHHDPLHKQLIIGEETKVIIRISACDTPAQVKELTDMGKEGYEAFRALYSIYMRRPNEKGDPICGVVTDIITPIRLLYIAEVGAYKISVFVFTDSEGDAFIGFTPLPVLAGQEA